MYNLTLHQKTLSSLSKQLPHKILKRVIFRLRDSNRLARDSELEFKIQERHGSAISNITCHEATPATHLPPDLSRHLSDHAHAMVYAWHFQWARDTCQGL